MKNPATGYLLYFDIAPRHKNLSKITQKISNHCIKLDVVSLVSTQRLHSPWHQLTNYRTYSERIEMDVNALMVAVKQRNGGSKENCESSLKLIFN